MRATTHQLSSLTLTLTLAFTLAGDVALAERYVRPPPPGAGAGEPEAPPPAPTPPELTGFVEADYPPAALAAGLEAEVVVRVDIAADGTVSAAEVTEPAGHGFDEAALAAVRRFRFAPARVGDEAVASRILYRYRFELQEEAPPPPEPAGFELRGAVTDLDGEPVAEARVVATRLEAEDRLGEPVTASTDAEGRFAIAALAAGPYELTVEAAGFETWRASAPLALEADREVDVRLEREDARYETVIRARRPGQQMTTRTIDQREATRVPGSSGDPLRVIQNMPGMGRTPMGLGALIVRGSPPGDTQVLLETVGIPLLYHFGGLTSIINSRFLEAIDFMPGNYPIRYGGSHGGVVEVRIRELQQEPYVGWHGEAGADIIDAELALEGPIVDGLSFAVGVRRSYIDLVAGLFAGLFDGVRLSTAPRYWDWQAILQYQPNARHSLRAIGYGSDDALRIVASQPPDSGEVVMGSLGTSTAFHGVLVQYRYRPDLPLRLNVIASAAWLESSSSGANLFALDIDNFDFDIRPELTLVAGEWGRFVFGAKLPVNTFSVMATLPDLNSQGCALDVVTRPFQSATSFGPLFYLEAQLQPFERLRITTGLQADLYDYENLLALEPRLWVRYELREGTAIEGGLGAFHQAPGMIESDYFFGNPDLGLERSVHLGLGLEQRIWGPLNLTINGFYKSLDRLAVDTDRTTTRDGEVVPLRYEASGLGRIYGLEVMLRAEPTRWFFGWLSYTLMRSERRDDRNADWYLSSWDQTHILTLVAGVSLPRGWEIGLRFQLTSGRPYTPIAGAIYQAECDSYSPVGGEPRSERMPLFHQLDLRIDKTWTVRRLVRFNLYLDVMNIYYAKNAEFYFYSFDYSRRYPINGLPIIPNIGLDIEF